MDFLFAVCIAGCRAPTVAPPDCRSLAAIALCKGLMSRQFSIIRTAMLWSKCHCRHSHASCRPRHASWLLCHASCVALSFIRIVRPIHYRVHILALTATPHSFYHYLIKFFFLPSLCNLYIYNVSTNYYSTFVFLYLNGSLP